MDETYDVIICGTGLVESILSGFLSQSKKKVLHMDKNGYYGGDGASLNLTKLWKLFRPGKDVNKTYGHNRDWNIDLIPKFVMADGKLVRMLIKTGVSAYLEWLPVDGTFVYQYSKGGIFSSAGGKIYKVPSNDREALKSSLLGLLEKNKARKFFQFIMNYNEKDPKTHKKMDFNKQPFSVLIKYFSLTPAIIDFVGHAVALYPDESFVNKPIMEVYKKIILYMNSVGAYGESPFIYPIYGLAGIPEGFSRKCALYGGTFMLNKNVDKFVFDENNKICGVESEGQVAKAKMVICSPNYLAQQKDLASKKIKKVGNIIRCICILDKPIPNTNDVKACQIILPQKQTKRKNDIYVMMMSNQHQVCKKGYYIAIISTQQETETPGKELGVALNLFAKGSIKETFLTVSAYYKPVDTSFSDNLFITDSMSHMSHFERETKNVLDLYKKIFNEDLDLTNLPDQ